MANTHGIDISQLNPEQRLDLIDALLESFSAEDLPISDQLTKELDRRMAAIESGDMQTHSWEEVKASLWPRRS